MSNTPHANASDLPGWSCPPRVRDIPNLPNSWGWLPICTNSRVADGAVVAIDELGRLWVDGNASPRPKWHALSRGDGYGAIVFWTEQGIGLWVYTASYVDLADLNTLDVEPGRWLPVAVISNSILSQLRKGPVPSE